MYQVCHLFITVMLTYLTPVSLPDSFLHCSSCLLWCGQPMRYASKWMKGSLSLLHVHYFTKFRRPEESEAREVAQGLQGRD